MPGRGLSPSEQGSRDGEPWRAGGGDRGAPESSTVPVVLKRGEGFSIAARCPATTGPDHQRAWELSSRTSQNQRQNLVTQRSGPRRRQGGFRSENQRSPTWFTTRGVDAVALHLVVPWTALPTPTHVDPAAFNLGGRVVWYTSAGLPGT